MLKRLLFGLLFGLLVGGLLAAAVIKGVGMYAFTGTGGAILAYVFAAVTGVLVGLVAGKPIWASGGQIEAGLKAVVGAAVAAAAMWAMRRWLAFDASELHSLGVSPAIPTAAGLLPAVTLPLIAAVLGAFYEADNTPTPDDEKSAKSSKGAAASKKDKVRVSDKADSDDSADDDAAALLDAPAKKAKK